MEKEGQNATIVGEVVSGSNKSIILENPTIIEKWNWLFEKYFIKNKIIKNNN